MPRYMIHVSYTAQGAQGLMKEGGSGRRQMVTDLLEAVGGKLESFYFAFGEDDAYVICEVPDNETAAAISLSVSGAGAARAKTTVLMTPEEVDRATSKTINYRAPGA